MGGNKHHLTFLFLICAVCLNLFSQAVKDLDDYKNLGRDSIIGCAKHELMWRYKKIGLNINCYSRIEVLAGVENGKDVLYVNFDNPIRIKELVSPDRIGINLLNGQSYYSGRDNLDAFYCISSSNLLDEFINCLEKAQSYGRLGALPGAASNSSSYMNVSDYGDHYVFVIVSGSSSITYKLDKKECLLKEFERNIIDQSETLKPYLEVIK